jgi:hypothetical protein
MNHIRLALHELQTVQTAEGRFEDRWIPSLDVTVRMGPVGARDHDNGRKALSAIVQSLKTSHFGKVLRLEIVSDWRFGPQANWEARVAKEGLDDLDGIARSLEPA